MADARKTGGSAAAVELSPFYYLHNFQLLYEAVVEQYHDLLLEGERRFIQCLRDLPQPAACLYVRLISRVGPVFRCAQLQYDEIEDIPAALEILVASGLVQPVEALTLELVAQLFTRTELGSVYAEYIPNQRQRLSKMELVAVLEELDLDDHAHWQQVHRVTGEVFVEPLGSHEVALLELLFFGNRRQGLTDFVLSDLGVARYYPYRIDLQNRFFTSRRAVDEYIVCGELGDSHYEWQDDGSPEALLALARRLLLIPFEYASSEHRWYRLCNRVARDLERLGELELALELYRRSQLHPAREREVRVLEALDEWQVALQCIERIVAAPWCEEELDAVARIRPRLYRQLGQAYQRRSPDKFEEIALTVKRQTGSVERDTAASLTENWSSLHYVENTLMNALFGLAFWEVIFEPVEGAFFNPYQSAPRDLYAQGFVSRRAQLIEDRFTELERAHLPDLLVTAYQRYVGYQCAAVNWKALTETLIEQAAYYIPAQHLLAVWRRMLFDLGQNRRGFPDLIAFGDAPGAYQMIEVKGPGDKLQDSQKRWLRFFQQQQIPAVVAQVSWSHD